MNLNHATNKENGSTLSAQEWNNLAADVNELGAGGTGNGGVVSTEVDQLDSNKTFVKVGNILVGELTSKGDKGTNVGISGDNNINIEPRPAAGDGSGKNTPGLANRKGGNIALKPGDDIEFWGHKRGTSKSDEVSVKIMTEVPKVSDPTKTDEVAAKLQLNAGDIVLTSKDKQEDSDVMNITVNKAANTRGYLKVRAQAIDLRCEDHGGIAIQPKGEDGEGHENKIKFEHGGGDGLEFGTFNTAHTSLFTGDYRFNKNGVIKLATRQIEVSDKADQNDPTTAYKYVKNTDDDFYDFIRSGDPSCTWADIVSYISWLKSTHQGIFLAGLILGTGLANSEDGLPQIKILCGSNKSVTAQNIVDRASNITTTINGTTYNLTATLYGNQLRFTTLYNGNEVVVFMLHNSALSTLDLPEGLKLYTFSLSYDPVSSLNASTAKLTIGNFDFVGLF